MTDDAPGVIDIGYIDIKSMKQISVERLINVERPSHMMDSMYDWKIRRIASYTKNPGIKPVKALI